MSEYNALERVADMVAELVSPLVDAAQDEESFARFLAQMGWTAQTIDLEDLAVAVSAFADTVQSLGEDLSCDTLVELLVSLTTLGQSAAAVAELAQSLSSALGDPGASAELLRELAADIFQHLLLRWIAGRSLPAYSALSLLGLIDRQVATAVVTSVSDPLLERAAVERTVLAPEALAELFTDPVAHLRSRLGVRSLDTALDAEAMLAGLYGPIRELVVMAGGNGTLGTDEDVERAGDSSRRRAALLLPLPVSAEDQDAARAWVTLLVALVPAGLEDDHGNAGPGTSFEPGGSVTMTAARPGSRTELEFTSGIGNIFLPQTGAPIVHADGSEDVHLRLEFTTTPVAERESSTNLGADSLGLNIEGIVAVVEARFGRAADPRIDIDLTFQAKRAAFYLQPGEGDGFLASVLPADGIRFDFVFGLGWSPRRGVYFTGAAGLEVEFPIHTSLLGILTIDTVHLLMRADGDGLSFAVATTASLRLGPLTATVERMGLAADAAIAPGGGNVGPFDVAPAFLPPRGAGLVIDALVVTGGGHVLNDPENGRYGGILELKIGDIVTVTAIGLVTTRMPDGSEGFSLLIILTATFPPIQLGYGFTLSGLGGVLGLNRTMDLRALSDGIRTGMLDSILFPVDPVARATKVISDVESVFPTARDRFVIGLQARIGWGTPRLITADLGIIVELPLPLRIALIGRLGVVVPTEEAAVVELHLDVAGSIDTGRGELSIDARMHDSRLAVFTVFGDMAVRISWGATPYFLLSVGGFNPRFAPPPGFPQLDRITIALAMNDNPSVRLETYLALTSNTIQMGARVTAHAELDAGLAGIFTADVDLGFDALLPLVPFSFVVDVGGSIVIRRNRKPLVGAEVLLTLHGPQPMRAVGYAEVHFLGTHRIPFDIQVGPSARPAAVAAVDPLDALLTALGRPESWSALPGRDDVGLSFREIASPDVLAHPLASLSMRQRVVPLDVRIERFGGTSIKGGPRSYTVTYRLGDEPASAATTLRDAWAPGEFFTLQDDEKLSRPSFEHLPSGHTDIAASQVAHGTGRSRFGPDYETRVIDTERVPVPAPAYRVPDTVQGLMTALDVSHLAVGYTGPDLTVSVTEQTYRVVSTADLAPTDAVHPTWVEASAVMAAHDADTGKATLQVVGAHEVPT